MHGLCCGWCAQVLLACEWPVRAAAAVHGTWAIGAQTLDCPMAAHGCPRGWGGIVLRCSDATYQDKTR
jgi:hypothetical protein